MEQRTDEWYQARLGKVTASRIEAVMAKGKNGNPSETRKNYMTDLLVERLTGEPTDFYTSADMQYGIDMEDFAKLAYMEKTGNAVNNVGFIDSVNVVNSGASPDGLIGFEGGIEIKCPKTKTHLNTIMTGKIKRGYLFQIQWCIYCTDCQWWDFVSYDNRLPDHLQLYIQRVERDEDMIQEIKAEVEKFLKELDEMEFELNNAVQEVRL